MPEEEIRWKTFIFEAGLYLLSLVLGVLAGWKLKGLFASVETVSILEFVIVFVVLTGIVVLMANARKGKRIFFKAIFLITIILGNLFFLSLWLSDAISLLIVLVLLTLWFKKSWIIVHDILIVLAIAGIGARIGISLKPEIVVILLLVFSVYDYIAVYKTKHMVKMAQEMVNQRAILGIVVPQTMSDWFDSLKNIQSGGKFMILGAGDIIFPLILAVSANSFIIVVFSLLGLLLGFYIFKKNSKPMPALPAIAIFSIIGYLVTIII